MESKLRNVPFRRIFSDLHLLHQIEVNEDEFIDIALTGWKKIGNKEVIYVQANNLPIEEGNIVRMPCDVEEIKSVSIANADYNSDDYLTNYSVESAFKDPRETEGHLIPYTILDNTTLKLYRENNFSSKFNSVNIIYKTVKTDEEGLPFLNDRELDALVKWCVFNYYQRRMFTDPKINPQLVEYFKQEWQRQCANARVKDFNTNNMTNTIFKFLSSVNIKQYNRTHRLFKDV